LSTRPTFWGNGAMKSVDSSTQRQKQRKKNTRPKSPWTVGNNEELIHSWPPLHSTAFWCTVPFLRKKRSKQCVPVVTRWLRELSLPTPVDIIYTAYKTKQTHLTFVGFVRTLLSVGHPRPTTDDRKKSIAGRHFKKTGSRRSSSSSQCTLDYMAWVDAFNLKNLQFMTRPDPCLAEKFKND